MKKPIVSLCIPTNGVIEWVFPVLESISKQGVDSELFEVVVTDNGNNIMFKNKMKEYVRLHNNIIYEETNALPFLNEIESYKKASGELIKFVNHRTLLSAGALKRMIDYAEKYKEIKPIIYFSNGVLKLEKECHEYTTFDQFVKNLSCWSSWSTGMCIWKSDFEKLPTDLSKYNELFPHTTVLFNERARGKYVIDNEVIFDEMPQGKKPKGNYDLFGAFGIEYLWIIFSLLKDKSISYKTFKFVKKKNLEIVASLYWDFCVRKKYCSYDLNGFEDMFGVFYTRRSLYTEVIIVAIKNFLKSLIMSSRNERGNKL